MTLAQDPNQEHDDMSEAKQQRWAITYWIVYTGSPTTGDFRVIAGGLTEKDALRAGAIAGLPAGAKVGQIREASS